jgi:hypothetical protein
MSFERWDRADLTAQDEGEVLTGPAEDVSPRAARIAGCQYRGPGEPLRVGVQYEARTVSSGGEVTTAGTTPFDVLLIGLLPGQEYDYRAFVDGLSGRYVGDSRMFATPKEG